MGFYSISMINPGLKLPIVRTVGVLRNPHGLLHGLVAYLWCDVVWCAAEGRCQSTVSDVFLAHTKVGHLDVTVCI